MKECDIYVVKDSKGNTLIFLMDRGHLPQQNDNGSYFAGKHGVLLNNGLPYYVDMFPELKISDGIVKLKLDK